MNRSATSRFITGGAVSLAMVCALGGVAKPVFGAQDAAPIDPEATQVLQQMSDYLDSLEQFTLRADNTIDRVMQSGQQLQMSAHVDISIRRPNRFRVIRNGDLVDQEFYFDGKTLTLYGKQLNFYANMTASETMDINTVLELAREEVGVIVPAADLVYHDAYLGLMEGVESGTYVGESSVDGVEVHHLAFRGVEVDWQIWVEKGNKPLPRKFLITSKWITGAPQFMAVLSDWNTSAKLEDALFQFSPPPDAEKIDFIRSRPDPASTH